MSPLPHCFDRYAFDDDPIDPLAEDENYFGKCPMDEPCGTPEIERVKTQVRLDAKGEPPCTSRPE